MRKILAGLISICMMFTSASFPVNASESQETISIIPAQEAQENVAKQAVTVEPIVLAATEGDTPEDITEDIPEVSRVQWLKELTETFDMTVEEDNYPDNYFSDIDATYEYYYEVMLATEFGLVDVEAGEPLRPDDAATREFAAHTLNLCLGYSLEEGTEYTFTEKDTVTYPNDVQVAVNRGWFALQAGAFLPDSAITVAEKDAMLADAVAIQASTVIDPEYNSTFEFADGVIVLPEDTSAALTDDNEITLYNNTVELKAGDVFGIVQMGIPTVKKIVSLEVQGEETICRVEGVSAEEAFKSLDIQKTVDVDLLQVQAYDEEVALHYIVGGTAEENWEDGTKYDSVEEVGEELVSAVEVVKSYAIPESVSKKFDLAPGMTADITCKISNVKADFDANLNIFGDWGKIGAYFDVDADITFSCNVSLDVLEAIGVAPSVQLVKVPVLTVGYMKVNLDMTLEGNVTFSLVEHFSAGIHVNVEDGFRFVHDFYKKSFTIQAHAEASVGVKASVGFDVFGALKGSIYAKVGGKAVIDAQTYDDGKTPLSCVHMSAWLYLNVGAEASADLIVWSDSWKKDYTIYNQKNSPVRVVFHYEDGVPVDKCTRDGEESDGGSTGGSGSSSGKKYKYYTPITSQYGYSGANSGVDSSGNTYTIFDYSLDEEGNATITKYNGNVSALNIPSTLDGHPVVGIGGYVFENNSKLRIVVIPDSVISIGIGAFQNCTNLSSVLFAGTSGLLDIADKAFAYCSSLQEIKLPDAVTRIGAGAFGKCTNLSAVNLPKSLNAICAHAFFDCDKLTSIEIPKKLQITYDAYIYEFAYGYQYGPFYGCDGLKNVTFEEGTTLIPIGLFANCSGIETIAIPDTVTKINSNAFINCSNLKNITFSNALISIGNYAFENCSALLEVDLPTSLTSLGCLTFGNCDGLTSIEIPKNVTSAGVTSIWLGGGPNYRDGGPFTYCDNLKEVSFEEGSKEIAGNILTWCAAVETVRIPDSVTTIYGNAFQNCYALKTVELPDSITAIGPYVFNNCYDLENIQLPKYLREIGEYSFNNCDSLTYIEIPKSLESIWYSAYSSGPFSFCDKLEEVKFEEGTKVIVGSVLQDCVGLKKVIIPNTVEEIRYGAFEYCVNLTDVEIPESVTIIEGDAFTDCWSLESIKLPEKMEWIGTSVFYRCDKLREVILPTNITYIPMAMFEECNSLESIMVPKTVTRIASAAFRGSGLKEINLPENVTKIDAYAFKECASLEKVAMGDKVETIGEQAFIHCTSLAEIKLGENVQTIGAYAFYNCDAMTSIALPRSVQSIGDYVFARCEILTDVKLESGLTMISQYAFLECPALAEIALPYSITTIGSSAFADCTALTAIMIPRATTNISTSAFSYPDKLTIYGVTGTYAEEYAANIGATFVGQEIEATEVNLNKETMSLYSGKKESLILNITPQNFTDEVSWVSTNEDVVSVSSTGLVSAESVGTATVRVYVGDKSASCVVTVLQPVTNISLNKSLLSLEGLQSFTLTANVSPSSAHNKEIAWSSADESIATVDENGVVTARAKGETTITATAQDGSGVSRSCTVTVTCDSHVCTDVSKLESAHNYANNTTEIWCYILEGAEELAVTFDAQTNLEEDFDYLYVYDNEGNEVGAYTGTQLAGQTIVVPGDRVKLKLVTNVGGTAWGFKVTDVSTVQDKLVTGITLSQSSLSLEVSRTHGLTATVLPSDATNKSVNWSSENESIATVDANGLVTAVGKGETTITATAKDGSGVTASCVVTVTKTETKPDPEPEENPFADVPTNKWYYSYVEYAYNNGLMSGTGTAPDGKPKFAPEANLTREQFAQVLHNHSKNPEVNIENKFTDVKQSWYTNAVLWANANDIVSGYPNGKYGVGDNITREQLAVMFYKYAILNEYNLNTTEGILEGYADDDKVSGYAVEAMTWAISQEIITGKPGQMIDPKGYATRAEVATMMMKLVTKN